MDYYMTDDVNERIVARVRHCKPMSTKPQDIDVFVPKMWIFVMIIIRINILCKFNYYRMMKCLLITKTLRVYLRKNALCNVVALQR